MYSYEDRIRAVKLYIKLGKRLKATIRQLGYPTKNSLIGWYREYERSQDLQVGVHLISVQKVTVRVSPQSEDWRGVCSRGERKCLSRFEFLLVSRSVAESLFAWSISAASTRFRCSN